MWKALRYKHFARLFYASLISQAGSKIHRIALLLLVYSLTHDAIWISLVLAAQLVATMGVGPLIAAWSDTQERRRLLVGSDFLRALLVPLIPLVGIRSLPLLLVLVFVVEVLRIVHDPIASAVIPELLPEEGVDAANSLILFAERFAEVAFVAAAGALVAFVGTAPAFWLDALTYLVSGVLLLRLPRLDIAGVDRAGYWSRVRGGLSHILNQPAIRRTVLTLFTAAMFGSVETALAFVLAISFLQVGSAGFGVMEAMVALGAVLGTFAAPYFSARISRERLFLIALFGFGVCEAAMGAAPIFALVLAALLIFGVMNMLFIIPARSILQLNTPTELRGRTFAAFGAVMNGAVIIGTMLGGALAQPLGAPLLFVVAGLLVAVVALATFIQTSSRRLATIQPAGNAGS
jgi:MFS family permease